MPESEVDYGQHVIFTNAAGSVHFTRYKDGRTSPMVDPTQSPVVEYEPGYLENKAERDARYRAGLDAIGSRQKRSWFDRLFGLY